MKLTRKEIQEELCLDIDRESVCIYWNNENIPESIPICYWHMDEVIEDPETVSPAIWNAIRLYYEDREELIKKMGHQIV